MKWFLLLGIVTITCCCNSRFTNSGTTKKKYLENVREFFRQTTKISTGEDYIVVDQPITKQVTDCLNELLNDSTIFNENDKETIRSQVLHPLVTKWNSTYFERAVIISKDTISSIFKDRNRQWTYFYQKYGKGFYSYSAPIFLKNNSLCVIYASSACGGLCGSGDMTVYRKQNGVWTYYKFFCMWIS